MSTHLIYSVGQCGFDHSSIADLASELNASTVNISDEGSLISLLDKKLPDLILVNRILDRDGANGLEIIKRLKQHPQYQAIPIMLVSNYADAQKAAVQNGAIMGFGKDNMFSKETAQKIAEAIGS